MILRIGTWNVAGFRKLKSSKLFDYEQDEDLEYFASQIDRCDLDILCLQETQVSGSDSQASRLAKFLKMDYVFVTPGCPSHIQKGYNITPAILSRIKFTSNQYQLLPYPSFELKLKGKVVPPYDRYVQTVAIDGFNIANMHPEPLETLGMNYELGEGNIFAKDIDSYLGKLLDEPIIFAADFNIDKPLTTLNKTVNELKLKDATPDKPTLPDGRRLDHILFSPDLQLVDSGIVKTETDHYLCWAELSLDFE